MIASGLALAVASESPAETPDRPQRGFRYLHDQEASIPWSIHILEVERAHPGLEFCTTLGEEPRLGMRLVSEQVKSLPPELGLPVAAVNGDFYSDSARYPGRPRNLQIHLGELVSSPSGNTAFWMDPEGKPCLANLESRLRVVWPDGTATAIGLNEERRLDAAVLYTAVVGASTRTRGGSELILERGTNTAWLPLRAGQTYSARIREVRTSGDSPVDGEGLVLSLGPKLAARVPATAPGDFLQIVTETEPDLAGVKIAIGGGPRLVENGTPRVWSGLQFRHPRTAIGWNQESLFLVGVDGRQRGLSAGMTLSELAAYMVKLGCTEAMNLDGGGSATFWVLGNVINSPSEGRERPAANALVLIEKRGPGH